MNFLGNVLTVFQGEFKEILRLIHGNFNVVCRMFHRCFQNVSWILENETVLQECFKSVYREISRRMTFDRRQSFMEGDPM